MPETPQTQLDEATVDLLIKQVTEGLVPAEQRALDVLDAPAVSAALRELEHAAAAITLARAGGEPLPAALSQHLVQQAAAHFSQAVGRSAATDGGQFAGESNVSELRPARQSGVSRAPTSASKRAGYGWLAAAACLVLAVFGWMRSTVVAPPPEAQNLQPAPALPVPAAPVPAVPVPAPEPAPPPSLSQQREALLAAAGTVKVSLSPTKDPLAKGVRGDIVWDPQTQSGFMHFSGLASNDPSKQQYQLWVFDATRDKKYPVDGGVFDVPAGSGDVVIPIRASLMVRMPTAFAVTAEQPGGAVVSRLKHVVAMGPVG